VQKNIFVIGDLKIDHDVFVEEVPPESGHTERTYRVLRRHDTAGGAANTARILAVLNEGATYLWGVLGRSRWGSFRTILENSNSFDDARKVVELRGVHDESDSPMHTEMRLLLMPKSGNEKDLIRVAHVSDINHLHVPLKKRQISIYYHLNCLE
jgi:bifunctional ADP-heptose synthase (sugar kinase/adenylyltransferase)